MAATFEGGLEAQAELMRAMGNITSAVVIITNQVAGMEEVCLYVCVSVCSCFLVCLFVSVCLFFGVSSFGYMAYFTEH